MFYPELCLIFNIYISNICLTASQDTLLTCIPSRNASLLGIIQSWVEIYFALKIGMCSEEVTLKYNGSWPGILIRDGVRHSMLGIKNFDKSWIWQKTYSDVILCWDWLGTGQGNPCSGWKTLINLRLGKRRIPIIYNAEMYYDLEQIIATRTERWSVLTQYTSDERFHDWNRNANPSCTGRRIIS